MAIKPEKLTDEQIVTAVNQEFEHALGSPGGELSHERANAMDYFLQKQFPDDDEDMVSKVVTSDTADVVDSMMPVLLRMFTTQDNLVSFDPTDPSDEPLAQQASDYISYLFFKRNPAFQLLYNAFWDSLVQKTGIWKCYWDESEKITQESYEGLTEEELYDLAADDEIEVDDDSVTPRQETVYDEETGESTEVTVFDVSFRRVTKYGCVKIDNMPPEEYRVSQDCRDMDPSTARMVGHEREVTRDYLLSLGFDKKTVMELSADGGATTYTEKYAREDKSDDRKDSSAKSPDKSQDKIVLREAYIQIDADGDGRAELLQVFSSGTTLLSKEPADRQPFHVICPYPLPHKHIGRSAADKTKDIQEINSTLIRQTLGNLYHSNQPGHGVWEQGIGDDTMDDLLTTKVGSVTRFARPVGESYTPMTVPFTAGTSFPMIEYWDKAKKDRTGISSDGEGLSPDALKNIQTTVMSQALDLSKMKIEAVARIYAETGLKTLFLHMHELVLKHQQKSEIIKLRGEWVPIDPTAWRERKDLTVNIGLGIGTRENNLMHLEAIKGLQGEIIQGGGGNLIVKPKHVYNMAAEVVKNANYKNPEMFFEDPGDALAPPPSDEQQEMERQQMELQQRQQQLDMERQQVKARELELKAQEQQLNHQREIMKLKEKAQEREDKMSAENEKLRNDLLRLQLQKEADDRKYTLEEADTAATIAGKRAQAEYTRAQTEDLLRPETETPPDPLEVEKTQAEIARTMAQAEKEEASRDKIRAETDGVKIENMAAVDGINELLDEANGDDTEEDSESE